MSGPLHSSSLPPEIGHKLELVARARADGLGVSATRQALARGHEVDASAVFRMEGDLPRLVIYVRTHVRPTIIDLRDGSVVQEAHTEGNGEQS